LFLKLDGIAVYGTLHTITNNKIESNGISETSGVVGDGYSGIALNGAKYCIIQGNTIQDVPYDSVQNFNLDAALVPNNTISALTITHNARTQNYAISEVPAFVNTTKYTLVKSGVMVTGTTPTAHNLINGQWVKLDDDDGYGFSGYYTVEVLNATQFRYDMTGADPMPADGTYSGDQYFSLILKSDYHQIIGNNLANNLNNPGIVPSAGGYRAFTHVAAGCGANTQKGYNFGQ
jgi:hypothetical protein